MSQELKIPLTLSLSPALYLVATPIGNLGDVTIRAMQVLTCVDHIFCEDTRMTKKLLSALGLSTHAKINVYNDHSKQETRDYVIKLIQEGQTVALVSDAGMPLISDPGYKLVRACRDAGVAVTAVPGANAALSALSISGLPSDHFQFVGFIPNKDKARRAFLQNALRYEGVSIAYETAPRLVETIKSLAQLDDTSTVVIARELTKKFEEVLSGTAQDLSESALPTKGEIVLLIKPSEQKNDQSLEKILRDLLQDHRLKEAVEMAVLQTGCPRNDVYKVALEIKNG